MMIKSGVKAVKYNNTYHRGGYMTLSIKKVLPLTAAGMLSLASCNNIVQLRSIDYAIIKNKPYTELEKINSAETPSLKQAKLDSLAFRDIFNSTQAAKDSDKIAEFEALAVSMQSSYNEIDKILTDEGITKKEYNFDSFNLQNDNDDDVHYQYFADNWMYRKFLTKHGLMTDSVQKVCDLVSRIIKP